jgi:tetratricopeptide (TPR) repeat protein
MKNFARILALLMGLAAMNLQADDFQMVFDSANSRYEQGQYAEALELYSQIEPSVSDWKLYYNMGNCHFKLNHFLDAKICYLKARKIRPLHPSIKKNILIVNKLFKDKIPEEKIDFLDRMLLKVESLVSINLISVLLVIFVVMFNVSLAVVARKGKIKWALYGIFFFLILSLFMSLLHIYRVQKHTGQSVAVVISDDSRLRSGPGEDNTVLFNVNPGLEVRLIDKSGEWFQVSASADIAGWIRKDRLTRI